MYPSTISPIYLSPLSRRPGKRRPHASNLAVTAYEDRLEICVQQAFRVHLPSSILLQCILSNLRPAAFWKLHLSGLRRCVLREFNRGYPALANCHRIFHSGDNRGRCGKRLEIWILVCLRPGVLTLGRSLSGIGPRSRSY